MSRASRLFLLMDALRARRRPVSAAHLAAELAVSVPGVTPCHERYPQRRSVLVKAWLNEMKIPEIG